VSLRPAASAPAPVLAVPEGPTYAPPTFGLDDPVTAIEDALASEPPLADDKRAELILEKARLFWERFGAAEEAARAVREAASIGPPSLATVREGTAAFMRIGDLASAASFLRMELQLQSEPGERAAVLRHLASVLEQAGDRLGGQEALRLALEIDPDDTAGLRALASQSAPGEAADLWTRIARVRARGDDIDDALCAVRQALRLVPAHEGAVGVATDALVQGRRFAEAERMVRDAISEADAAGRITLYRRLAEVGRAAGRTALVAEATRQIVQRTPEDAAARRDLYAALATLGRTGDLVRFLRVDEKSEDPAARCAALEAELTLLRAALPAGGVLTPAEGEIAVRVAARLLSLQPEHAEALTTVRGDLERVREYGTLCDVLFRATEASSWSSPEALARRLVEVATLAEDKLGAVHRALGAWERVATLVQGPEAESAIARLRGKVKLQDSLLDLAERELAASTPDQRLPALRKVGGLVKDHPRMAARALAAYREILEVAPNDTAAVLALGRLYDALGDAEGAAWLLDRRLTQSPHKGERVRLLARLAEVLHEDLSRLDDARATCIAILELQPAHDDTLARLERLAVEAGDSGWLADALARRAAATAGADRADHLLALAALQEGPLGDAAAAAATLGQVLEARPDDWRALRGLARLQARRDEELADARDTAVRVLGLPAGRGDLRALTLLADVRVRLGDHVGARDALRALVSLDPGDEASGLALVELLLDDRASAPPGETTSGRLLGEAAETIESLYRSDIEPQVLAHLTRRAFDLLLTVPDMRLRGELLVGRWLDRVDPRDATLARKAAESAHERGDDAASARLLERALVGAAEAERSDLLMLEAERWDASGGLAAATRCRVRLLRARPHDPAVLSALEQTYARVGDAARLIAVLEMRLAAAVHRDERHDAYARLAAAARDLAGDPDRALAYLGRSAREAPGEARALDAIQGMLLRLGRHEELAAHLEARAEGAPTAGEQSSFLRQSAFVRDHHLADLPGAIRDVHSAVLVQLEASRRAHQARTERGSVEGAPGDSASTGWGRTSAPPPLYDGDALQELERLTAKARDVATMKGVYELLAKNATGTHGEKALLYRAGRFFEQLGLPHEAVAAYMRSFQLDPQSGAALRAIERIANEQADWEPLVRALQVLAEAAPDPGTRASALRRAAGAAEVGLLDRERALGLLLAAYATWGDPELELEMRRVARDIAGESAEAGPAAFQRLKAALERRAASALDAEDRARWVRKLARVDEEDRNEPRAAFEALLEVASASPEVVELADDLERLAGKLGDWTGLAQTYERIIAESLDPAVATEYRMRLARLDLAHLGGTRAETELRWLVAQRTPHATEAFDLLRRRFETTGARAELAALLETTLPSLQGDDRVQRTLETAAILDRDLADPASALAVCEATRAALGTSPAELRRTMLRLAEAAGDPGKVVALLQEELAATTDSDAILASWLKIAALREGPLADPAGALDAYRRALEVEPRTLLALDGAERAARASGASRALEEILDLRTRSTEGLDRARTLAREAAVVGLDGRLPAATRLFEESLAIDFDDAVAAALGDLHARQGAHEPRVRLLAERIRRTEDAIARAPLRMERAHLLVEPLGRPTDARDELVALLEDEPARTDALLLLLEIESSLGNSAAAAHFAERASTTLADRGLAAELLCRAATLLAGSGDEEGAERRFRAAVEVNPGHLFALRALAQLAERRQDLPALRGLHATLAEVDPAGRIAHLGSAARAAWEAADGAGALALLGRLRAEAPNDGPSAALEATILASTGRLSTPEERERALASLRPALLTSDPSAGPIIRFVIADLLRGRGETDDALRVIEEGCVQFGPEHPVLALGLAEGLSAAGRAAEALEHFEAALCRPTTWHRLRSPAAVTLGAGLAAAAVADHGRAAALLAGAEALEPAYAPRVHRALAEMALAAGDAVGAAAELRRFAETQSPPERARVLREAGEILARAGVDDPAAVACLEEALADLDPDTDDARRAMEAMADVAARRHEWGDVARLCERLLPRTTAAAAQTRLHLLGARAAAARADAAAELAHLEAARAADPSSEEAHGAYEAALATRGDHGALLRELDARLAGPDGAGRAPLLLRRGDLLRDHLGDLAGATAAYEEAARAGLPEASARLASLLARDPERIFDAVSAYRRLLEADPGDVEALRSLHRLYEEIGATHECAGVGSLLRLFDPSVAVDAPPPLDDIKQSPEGIVAALTPAGLSGIAELLALLWDGALHLFRHDLADFGIRAKDRISPLEQTPLARTFAASIRLLGLPRTGLFVRPHSLGAIELVATHPPSLVVSPDIQADRPEERFRIGRAVEATRPGHILVTTMPPARLRDLLLAVTAAFGAAGQVRMGTLTPDAKNLATELWKTIPPRNQRSIQELVGRLPDLRDPLPLTTATGFATARAGLVVAGDAAAAARVVAREDLRLRDLDIGTPEGFRRAVRESEALRDLVAFAVSEPYLGLRWRVAVSTRPRLS
jgi:tetratricopeptide (TPR) repeat protein